MQMQIYKKAKTATLGKNIRKTCQESLRLGSAPAEQFGLIRLSQHSAPHQQVVLSLTVRTLMPLVFAPLAKKMLSKSAQVRKMLAVHRWNHQSIGGCRRQNFDNFLRLLCQNLQV